MSRPQAYRLIDAAEVAKNLSPIEDIPTSEGVTRPLTKLQPDQQREAWALACAINPSPTAPDVQRVAQTIDRLG